MNESRALPQFRPYVLGFHLLFSSGVTAAQALFVPYLLLLDDESALPVSQALMLAGLVGGCMVLGAAAIRMCRYNSMTSSIGSGENVAAAELAHFAAEPRRLTLGWVVSHGIWLLVFIAALLPSNIDIELGAAIALLAAVMLAAASLPFNTIARRRVTTVLELAPAASMAEAVRLSSRRRGYTTTLTVRRIATAVATPVIFIAIGCALITMAHVRHADEENREALAFALARTVLDDVPGRDPHAGSESAIKTLVELGFQATFVPSRPYDHRLDRGANLLSVPLDNSSLEMRFRQSRVPPLSPELGLLAVLVGAIALLVGQSLGNALYTDLHIATRSVRLLGTEAVIRGQRLLLRSPRFKLVGRVAAAVDRLSEKFRTFAQAQEDAIASESAATRMRGLFFASVSHDLKGPLNAILGFTELVRSAQVTEAQAESLDVVHRRSLELLALIETILDAARVEDGHLLLVEAPISLSRLLTRSLEEAAKLNADRRVDVSSQIIGNLATLNIDRSRVSRAIATLIAYSVRNTRSGPIRVIARVDADQVQIDVDSPLSNRTALDLEAILHPMGKSAPRREHRGLALGVSLARSIIELHHGTLRVVEGNQTLAYFRVELPIQSHDFGATASSSRPPPSTGGSSVRAGPRTNSRPPPPSGGQGPARASSKSARSALPRRVLPRPKPSKR